MVFAPPLLTSFARPGRAQFFGGLVRTAVASQRFAVKRLPVTRKSASRILDLSMQSIDNTTVLAHMHWEMKGAAKLPGWDVPEPRTGVMSLLWVQRNGEWRVRALHSTDSVAVPELPNF